jgi:microsomal dipeptidase-like Zn-dependent dipeptidase
MMVMRTVFAGYPEEHEPGHAEAANADTTRRTRRDEELLACTRKGGPVCVTAVPNSLSDDPHQDINCVLPPPAAYLNGLESPADGFNIIRGLIARGYSDRTIRKIAGLNALQLLRRVIG